MTREEIIDSMIKSEKWKLESAQETLRKEKEYMASMISDKTRPYEVAAYVMQKAEHLQRAAQEVETITKNIEQLNYILDQEEE